MQDGLSLALRPSRSASEDVLHSFGVTPLLVDGINSLLCTGAMMANPLIEVEVLVIPATECHIPHRWKSEVPITEDQQLDFEDTRPTDVSYSGGKMTISGDQLYLANLRGTPHRAGHGGETPSGSRSSHAPLAFGMKYLKQALHRLGVPQNEVEQINRINEICGSGSAVVALANEKKRVKEELKKYDVAFRSHFGELPTKTEKEPMRPLYAYYKKMRGALLKRNSTGKVEVVGAGKPTKTPHDEERRSTAVEGNEGRGKITASPSMQPSGAADLREDIRRLRKLEEQKATIAARLKQFQDSFSRANGRKVIYHKDIVPVEGDYRKYKLLREQVTRLSESISRRQRVAGTQHS